jgi:glycosyltransferase involved in cell wall biosynthesis
MGGVETLALQGKDAAAYWQKIQRLIRDLNLAEQIHCTGYVEAETASRYLSGSDLGVLPFNPGISLKSGSLLTMLAHRLPAIATCTRETDSVLIDKHIVAPVAPRNSDALAEVICRLLDSPVERQRLADSGHAFVQPFAWTTITAQHHAIYQRLLKAHQS